jgi:serine protease Do
MLDPVRAKARVIALAAATFVGGVALASAMEWTAGSHAAGFLQGQPSTQDVRPVAELSEAFVAISESVTPSVVNIRTERTTRRPARGHPPVPEAWRRFFDIPEGGGGGEMPAVPQEAGGTGFLISGDGHIMTNNHVVEGAEKITVILRDRREYPAQIVGRDPTTDIAVIRIEGSGFPSVRLGNPEATRVGEWVLAVGNPLGLDFTVTAGIVSAKGRPLPIIRETLQRQGQETAQLAIESFIQTDAAINPGNSGGPLVNLRGEVIGVNSAIASSSGFSEGYGFAIPIDLAQRVGEDLIRYGRVRRPILGVQINEVTVEDAEVFQLPAVAGAVVQSFSSDASPARQAGLRQGDVIVAVNGVGIGQVNELQRRIASQRPGDQVTLDVIRYGVRQQVQVRLAEAESQPVAAAPQPAAEEPATGRLGVRVAPLSAERARELGYSQAGGVVMEEVAPYGPVGRRGFRPGWKVVELDRQEIRDVAHFERLIRAKPAGSVASLILESPDGQRQLLNIRLQG